MSNMPIKSDITYWTNNPHVMTLIRPRTVPASLEGPEPDRTRSRRSTRLNSPAFGTWEVSQHTTTAYTSLRCFRPRTASICSTAVATLTFSVSTWATSASSPSKILAISSRVGPLVSTYKKYTKTSSRAIQHCPVRGGQWTFVFSRTAATQVRKRGSETKDGMTRLTV